jgi:hypothetical protein
MTAVMKEIGAQQAIWTAPYAARPTENLTPTVVVQRRPYLSAGRAFLLVANPTYEAQSARVRLPGAAHAGAAADRLRGTPGIVADGVLTDTLAPLQAKCYELP